MLEVNKIHHGDCLELMKEIPDKSVDCVITDPPFKISQTYSANVDSDNLIAVSSIFPAFQELFRVCKPGGYMVVYYDMRILPLIFKAMKYSGWKYLRGLTFYRRWGNAHKLYGWMSTSDFILIFRKPTGAPYKFYSTDWRHDVYIKDKPEDKAMGHPAQKPISDFEHIIKHLCPNEGIVLDPYIGSGTTAVACLNTGRNFIGIELEGKYVEIARKRIAERQMTLKEQKNQKSLFSF